MTYKTLQHIQKMQVSITRCVTHLKELNDELYAIFQEVDEEAQGLADEYETKINV